MHENHAEGNETYLQHLASGKNSIGVGVAAKHPAQHSHRDGEVRGAKKYPGDTDRGVSSGPGQNSNAKLVSPILMLEQNAQDAFDDEIGAMEQTPNHKGPGRAVPKAAQKHHDDQIDR